MSTEKVIRNQAKQSLKGNWSIFITAFLFLCTVILFFLGIKTVVSYAFNLVDTNAGYIIKGKELEYNIINFCSILVLIFLSPFVNGIYRMFSMVSQNKKIEITDIFYYFKAQYRYLKTLILNILLLIIFYSISCGFDIYAYICAFTGKNLQDNTNFGIIKLSLIAAMLASAAIKVLVYFIFMHYSLFAYASDDSMSIFNCTFGLYGFSLRHILDTIKLLCSFIGWIALCFFVIPVLYVLPYIMNSFATSAKWLFALEKDRRLLC